MPAPFGPDIVVWVCVSVPLSPSRADYLSLSNSLAVSETLTYRTTPRGRSPPTASEAASVPWFPFPSHRSVDRRSRFSQPCTSCQIRLFMSSIFS